MAEQGSRSAYHLAQMLAVWALVVALWSLCDNKERPVGGQRARVRRVAALTEHTTTAYISSTDPAAVLLIMCPPLRVGSHGVDSIAQGLCGDVTQNYLWMSYPLLVCLLLTLIV